VAGLFSAAAGKPELAAGTPEPVTADGTRWLRLLDSATATLAALSRLADALIIALPIVVGSISWLIARLADIRLALAETLRFLLRQALMLRGLVAVTVFDTLAMVARTAAGVLGILQATVGNVLGSVFEMVREALLAVFDLAGVLGEAIKKTVDALLNWLVPTVDVILRNLGDLRVFRVLTHVIRILPAILPVVYELAKDHPIQDTKVLDRLNDAAQLPFLDPTRPGGVAATTPATPPELPNLRAILTDPATVGRATGALDRIQQVTQDGLRISGDAVTNGLRDIGGKLDRAAAEEAAISNSSLAKRLDEVRDRSAELSGQLVVGEKIRTETGLEAIADAYEKWLTGGGLDTLLGNITKHFASAEGRAGVPAAAAATAVMDRPRATVQIDEVIIEVGGAPPAPASPPPGPEPDW